MNTLYLYNLGPAHIDELWDDEVKIISDFMEYNHIHEETIFVHAGLNMEKRMDKDHWAKTILGLIKIPMIDGNKILLPLSMIKDKKEDDDIRLLFPSIIKNQYGECHGNSYISFQISQLSSQFANMGPFEEALKKIL